MKKIKFLLLVACTSTLFAQPNTEVYVVDVATSNEITTVSNFTNISTNKGYDNQPSFRDDEFLYYAKTYDGQTDVSKYSLTKGTDERFHTTTIGSEYSPQAIPKSKSIAAVRLDTNGLQRLYRYSHQEAPKELLLEKLQIAYYAFFDEHLLIGSVLSSHALDLVVANTQTQQVDTLLANVGRSFHKVPMTEYAMSYTAVNEDKNFDVYQLDMKSFESFFVTQLPLGVQDMAWLGDSKIIVGSGAQLYVYDLFGNGEWEVFADFTEQKIDNITRLSVSPNGEKLAFVAEPQLSPGDIVQKHIAPYNQGDLDAFAACFSEDVRVANFPNNITSNGRTEMKEGYRRFMTSNKNLSVKVVKRIIYKNIVIDEEVATVNDRTERHATIYETSDLIDSMTFISASRNKTSEDPTVIVDKQLEAYNARDIDGFMATYTKDIALYTFPNTLSSEGQKPMRENYAGFFKNTPDLHCEIKNRIVIGNKVIDEEYITLNGRNFSAVAIYEVNNGLISKVTFIQ